jgi:hypothetical protein
MDRLLELLAQIAALMDGAADPERPLAAVPQEELETLLSDLQAAYADTRENALLTTEVIDALERGTEAIQSVIVEDNLRVEEHSALEARAAELDALALPTAQEEEPDAPAEDNPAEAPAEEPAAPAEPAPEAAPEAEVVEAEIVEERVLVPATRQRVPLSRMRERQPSSARPVPSREALRRRVIAAAGLPNVQAGGEFGSRRELSDALIRTWDANMGAAGDGVQVAVARVETPYRDDHVIGPDASPFTTTSVMERVSNDFMESLVAAGGICAPTEPYYPQAMISTSGRPVFDGLPRVQATRGGINWIAPPTLASINTTTGSSSSATTAITQITAAQDAANATKPHQFIACGAPQSAQIYATTNILEFGNMQGRTYPELVDAWTGLAEAAL